MYVFVQLGQTQCPAIDAFSDWSFNDRLIIIKINGFESNLKEINTEKDENTNL